MTAESAEQLNTPPRRSGWFHSLFGSALSSPSTTSSSSDSDRTSNHSDLELSSLSRHSSQDDNGQWLLDAIAQVNTEWALEEQRFHNRVIAASEDASTQELERTQLDYWQEQAKRFGVDFISYCFDQQNDEQRPLFDVIAGRFCAVQARLALGQGNEEARWQWIERGLTFNDFYCLDRFCARERIAIHKAREDTAPFSSDRLERVENLLINQAHQHGTIGYGLIAETCHRIGEYHYEKYRQQRKQYKQLADSGLPIGSIINILPCDADQEKYRHYYGMALAAMTIAEELESQCQAITNYALFGESLLDGCGWLHRGAKSLAEMRENFTQLKMPAGTSTNEIINAPKHFIELILDFYGHHDSIGVSPTI